MKRWTIATLLLAPLLCHAADVTQLTLPAGPAAQTSMIDLLDDATARLHVYGVALLVDPAPDADVRADLVLLTQPPGWRATTGQTGALRIWDRVTVRKGRTRLHITALPDPGGRQAALMLDFGPSCRILVHGGTLDMADIEAVPHRYPGAGLALLRDADGPLLMTIASDGSAATLQRGQRLRMGPACGAKAR